MKKMMIASVLVAIALTGCNTFKGIGKDVSSAGKAVSNTASEASNQIKKN